MDHFSEFKLSRRDLLKAGAASATAAVVPSLASALRALIASWAARSSLAATASALSFLGLGQPARQLRPLGQHRGEFFPRRARVVDACRKLVAQLAQLLLGAG